MWQTSSTSVQRTADSFRSIVKIRREKCRRTDWRTARRGGHYDTVALRDEGSEWAVVQHAIAGSASAQEQLFAHHTDRLYRIAFSVLRNKEDAEDALQDGLCRAYTSPEMLPGPVGLFHLAYTHRHKLSPHDSPKERRASGRLAGRASG